MKRVKKMPNGFVNVLKAPGITSHDIINHLRKIYSMKKVGHAGTLDPAAAGVLPVGLGKATRMLEYMDEADKSYKAEVTFGYSTDTGDDTGKVIEEAEYTMPSEDRVKEVLNSFRGTIKQRPPMHSAIRINGEKAYKLARKNIEVEMPEREVTIYDINLQEMTADGFIFEVVCSKGTYIRTLCRDIGKKLNIPTVMSFLIRSHVGVFKLDTAWSTEEIGLVPHKVLLPVDYPIRHLAKHVIDETEALMFKQGKQLDIADDIVFEDKYIRLYVKGVGESKKEEFAGIGRILVTENNKRKIAPHKVLL